MAVGETVEQMPGGVGRSRGRGGPGRGGGGGAPEAQLADSNLGQASEDMMERAEAPGRPGQGGSDKGVKLGIQPADSVPGGANFLRVDRVSPTATSVTVAIANSRLEVVETIVVPTGGKRTANVRFSSPNVPGAYVCGIGSGDGSDLALSKVFQVAGASVEG